MAKSQLTIRVGDRVEIIEDRFIERIGYPLVWTNLVPEFENHPNLLAAAKLLGIYSGLVSIPLALAYSELKGSQYKAMKRFVQGAAQAAVIHRGFGGGERQIYYLPQVNGLVGRIATVEFKKVSITGTYYPPSYDRDYDDYEPGGLDNRKSHVILYTELGMIEKCHVRKV